MEGDSDEVPPTELSNRLRSGEGLVLLDVRNPPERDYCAIPVPSTAKDLFIPMKEVPARLDEIREAAESFPIIIVYCHAGVRSGLVVDWLRRQGLAQARNLAGGIDGWSRDVDPGIARY